MAADIAPETVTRASSAWLRFRNRLRFGLATQEILDRVARCGLVVYPYYFVHEPVRLRKELVCPPGLVFRPLDSSWVERFANVPERLRDEVKTRAFMESATCAVALDHGEIVAHCWYTTSQMRGISGGDAIAPLPPHCAYLFDMFVCRRARGHNVAALLRNHVHGLLADQGIRHAISVSLVFNTSTRKFKAKLGSVESELRLLLRIKPFSGIDVRLHRKPWVLPTPRLAIARHGRP